MVDTKGRCKRDASHTADCQLNAVQYSVSTLLLYYSVYILYTFPHFSISRGDVENVLHGIYRVTKPTVYVDQREKEGGLRSIIMPRSFLSRALVGSCHPSTAPIQGLRVLATLIVHSGHALVFVAILLDQPLHPLHSDPDASSLTKLATSILISLFWYSVDIFFFISGFLALPALVRAPRPTRLSIYIIARYLRLAPLYLFIAFLYHMAGQHSCIYPREALFLKNTIHASVGASPTSCIGVGWSISVDFQAHIALALLAYFFTSPRILFTALMFISSITTLTRSFAWLYAGAPRRPFPNIMDIVYTEQYKTILANHLAVTPGNFSLFSPKLMYRRHLHTQYQPLYAAFVHRAAPVFIGAATSLALQHNMVPVLFIRRNPRRALAVVATICLVCHLSTFAYFSESVATYKPLFFLYEGFGRYAVSCVTAIIIILTCQLGASPPATPFLITLRAFLANRLFLILSRYCYSIYLIHPLVSRSFTAMWPPLSKDNFSLNRVHLSGLRWFCVSLLAAVPFCILEEFALMGRRRVLKCLTKDSANVGKQDKTLKVT